MIYPLLATAVTITGIYVLTVQKPLGLYKTHVNEETERANNKLVTGLWPTQNILAYVQSKREASNCSHHSLKRFDTWGQKKLMFSSVAQDGGSFWCSEFMKPIGRRLGHNQATDLCFGSKLMIKNSSDLVFIKDND